MRHLEIGFCHGPEGLAWKDAGAFSFREVTLSVIEEIDRAGGDAGALAGTLVPPARIVMGIFPYGTCLYDGPGALRAAMQRIDYVTALIGRIGAAALVFGAGAARSIPVEQERREGERTLVEIIGYLAQACARQGAMLLVENLPRGKSNVFNTIDDIAVFIDRHRLDNVFVVYDVKSGAEQGEDPDALERHWAKVRHVHVPVSDPPGVPARLTGAAVLARLRRAGYAGRVSIEAADMRLDSRVVERADHVASWMRAINERSGP